MRKSPCRSKNTETLLFEGYSYQHLEARVCSAFARLASAIITTSNFWDALFIKVSHRKKRIAFRNGIKLDLNWTDYCKITDWLRYLCGKAFTIEKADSLYRIKGENPRFRFYAVSLRAALAFSELISELASKGWVVKQLDDRLFSIKRNNLNFVINQFNDNLFSIESDKVKIIGPLDVLTVYLCECQTGIYDCDCANKVVLDVGGFYGETAVLFSNQGAKKVIVYEPVPAHHDLIRRNIMLNSVNAEVHAQGIGNKDGDQIIHYESMDLSFGILRTGKNEMHIKVRNVADVIKESSAEIAKFDCEGAEISLLSAPNDVLTKVDFYIIETHGLRIRNAIMHKFINAGFKLVRELHVGNFSILHFKRSHVFGIARRTANTIPYDVIQPQTATNRLR